MSTPIYNNGLMAQSMRFAATGGLNTAIGFGVIVALLHAGANDFIANAAGYSVGLTISFLVNRRWTFAQKQTVSGNEILLFLAAFAISYAANLAVLIGARSMGLEGNWAVHLAGVMTYSLCFFALSKTVIYPAALQRGAGGPAVKRPAAILHRHFPEIAAATGALACSPYLLSLDLTHDVSWQFWIARQMIGGVPLYERIMEINPPLWFWMAVPFTWIGDYLSVQPDRFYIAAIMAGGLWAAITTGRFLQPQNDQKRLLLMLVILALIWFGPLYDFGQREQIAAIFALPYCALIFKRRQGEAVGTAQALLIGTMAASGFALKHYFVLVPLALELWLFWRLAAPFAARLRAAFRPETIALAVFAIIYAGIVLIFTPAFMEQMVPLVDAAYVGYERPMALQLLRTEFFIWLLALVSIPSLRRKVTARDRDIGDVLTIAGIAFIVSYFLQKKGWQYHAIPATVLLALTSYHYLACQKQLVKAITLHPAAFMAALLFVPTGLQRGPYDSDWASDMRRYFDQTKPGDSIMILTTDPRRIFPFVEQYNLVWPSRYFSFWMIAAIANAETGHRSATNIEMTPALQRISAQIRRETVHDMECHPPALILSQIRGRRSHSRPSKFRMTEFFRRDAEFSAYLTKNYRLEKTDWVYETYRRVTPMVASGKDCYPIFNRS